MNYEALATDYDGTIATEGMVPRSTLEALERFQASGRKLVLVTGRGLDDLLRHVPCTELFDMVVAENGPHIYCPATGEEHLLGDPPPAGFADELLRRGVDRLFVGRIIVATHVDHEAALRETIDAFGAAMHMATNRHSLMALPEGIDKATGVRVALDRLGLSPLDTVAVGDAENDHALLRECGFGVAVANALPFLKEQADWVTTKPEGAGVEELIEHVLDGSGLGEGWGQRRRHQRPRWQQAGPQRHQ